MQKNKIKGLISDSDKFTEASLLNAQPIVLSELSDEEFNTTMERSMRQYLAGNCIPVEDVEAEFESLSNVADKKDIF